MRPELPVQTEDTALIAAQITNTMKVRVDPVINWNNEIAPILFPAHAFTESSYNSTVACNVLIFLEVEQKC